MNKKRTNILLIFALFVSLFSLIFNLHVHYNKLILGKSINEINNRYFEQKKLNQQQVLFQKFVFNEKFYSYNPLIKDVDNNIGELSEVIDSCSIVYRITSFSCSSCVDSQIDNILKSSKISSFQFIVLCTSEQVFLKLSRFYRYSGIKFFLIIEDSKKMSRFNDLFSSLYLLVDKNGFVHGSISDYNIQSFLAISSHSDH